jgi:hypothetical protein
MSTSHSSVRLQHPHVDIICCQVPQGLFSRFSSSVTNTSSPTSPTSTTSPQHQHLLITSTNLRQVSNPESSLPPLDESSTFSLNMNQSATSTDCFDLQLSPTDFPDRGERQQDDCSRRAWMFLRFAVHGSEIVSATSSGLFQGAGGQTVNASAPNQAYLDRVWSFITVAPLRWFCRLP